MFSDQLTLGRIPLVLVSCAIGFALVVLVATYRVIAVYPPTIQVPGVKHEFETGIYSYNADYHVAFGRRFLKIYGRWNNYNFERQMLFAMDMASDVFRGRIQERYAKESAIATTLKITHMAFVRSCQIVTKDPGNRSSQVEYLVEEREWYAGTPSGTPHWYKTTLAIRDINVEKAEIYLCVVDGMERTEVEAPKQDEVIPVPTLLPFTTTPAQGNGKPQPPAADAAVDKEEPVRPASGAQDQGKTETEPAKEPSQPAHTDEREDKE